jgi:hypothetical protein
MEEWGICHKTVTRGKRKRHDRQAVAFFNESGKA